MINLAKTQVNLALLDNILGEQVTQEPIKLVNLKDGDIDPRYTRGSYSTYGLLHSCPRKFQLKCLQSQKAESSATNVTFAFGHAVGNSIAHLLKTNNMQEAIWNMFLEWDVDFLEENEKQKKSFPYAVHALKLLAEQKDAGVFESYEVAELFGKPAVELSFKITIPGNKANHTFRGFIDIVLRNAITEELVVMENKTDSGTWVNHYKYKNSAQALGYSVVLNMIEPELTSYEVLYYIYMTKLMRFEDFAFHKSKHMQALWLRDLLWDIKTIETLVDQEGNYGIWPMRGESCTNFGRTCEYMDICEMDTAHLMAPLKESDLVEEKEYDINLDFAALI